MASTNATFETTGDSPTREGFIATTTPMPVGTAVTVVDANDQFDARVSGVVEGDEPGMWIELGTARERPSEHTEASAQDEPTEPEPAAAEASPQDEPTEPAEASAQAEPDEPEPGEAQASEPDEPGEPDEPTEPEPAEAQTGTTEAQQPSGGRRRRKRRRKR